MGDKEYWPYLVIILGMAPDNRIVLHSTVTVATSQGYAMHYETVEYHKNNPGCPIFFTDVRPMDEQVAHSVANCL